MSKKNRPDVTTTHPKYTKMLAKWSQIRDVLGGEEAVKAKCTYRLQKYLPLPDTEADPNKNIERYQSYVLRAVFYNATARTLSGLVGQVFSKPPVATFPDPVNYLLTDPAGSGVTLEQHAKGVLGEVMAMGRAGLWVDYPTIEGGATRESVDSGLVRPVITSYKAEDIRNWRTRKVGAKTLLSLVVLSEERIAEDDGFSMLIETQYRELRLDANGDYCVRVWRAGKNGNWESPNYIYPVDNSGNRFREIPFVFVGISNNDSEIDEPPMYDISCVNLGHFRNSADYEESCFMVGQPTPWFAGITENWAENVLKGKVHLGSRGGIPLPAGGAAGLLQAQSNTLVSEALAKKEAQMIALGAKLVQASTGSIAKTATEVNTDKISEVSTLAAAARNTSAAYKYAFDFCAMFSGDDSEITFELSTDFEMSKMTSQDLLAVFTVWQGQGLSINEFRDILRKSGYAFETLEEAVKGGVVEKVEPVEKTTVAVDNNATRTQE